MYASSFGVQSNLTKYKENGTNSQVTRVLAPSLPTTIIIDYFITSKNNFSVSIKIKLVP